MGRWAWLLLPLSTACGQDAPRVLEREDAALRADAAPRDAGPEDANERVDASNATQDAASREDAARPTARCPASDFTPQRRDEYRENTGKTAVDAITYGNVGASGAYAEVVDGWSKATGCKGDSDGNLCRTQYRKPKQVSGALAPFDEEMTLVFAGPTELYRIGIYSPRDGAWARDAYWDRCTTEGLAFVGNKHWYECAGFVQSYVTADGTKESDTPVQFAGSVAAGTEVHVMASAPCAGDACGWTSGLALQGFAGDAQGSKMFVVELRMPIADKTPAYWILPSQVVRSSQYGCNCRGAGSDATYKGGCGELDVAEILGGVTTSLEATTTLYSFQDITGGGSLTFARPVHEAAQFVVVFDAPSRQIAIRRLGAQAFDFASSTDEGWVEGLLGQSGAVRALR